MYREIMEEQLKLLDNPSIIDAISDETDRISVVDWLNYVAKHMGDIADLSFNIRSKLGKNFILFKFTDYQGAKCSGGVQLSKSVIDTVDDITSLIIEGQWALKILNEKFSESQAKNGNILSIKFKLGFNKTASIAYWDYSTIIIRVSEQSIKTLISVTKDSEKLNELTGLIDNTTWPENIPELVDIINKSKISELIGLHIEYESISEALTENMLSKNDIGNILKKNKGTKGTQKLKSVEILDQLGLFAAILIWSIDYENSDVSVDILDNKVIDLENNRFVSDHSLYSRIEQRILEDTADISKILN